MARRTVDWNAGLAKDLKNKEFAQEFILDSIDEGLSIQDILGKVIRAYGIKEFSKKCGLASSNIVRAINPKHNPTHDTLNRLLKPFGLRIGISQIGSRRAS